MKNVVYKFLSMIIVAASTQVFAQGHDHNAHKQEVSREALVLNDGKKWETDAPLRTAMENIRAAFQKNMAALHTEKMPDADYKKLASLVEKEIASIFKNCKLAPKADAALHIILLDLIKGTDIYVGKNKEKTKMDGTILIFNALENYAKYFNHPNWAGLKHG